MIPADRAPHHRSSDRELVGWIRPDGAAWVAVSLLGADLAEPGEWLDAEAVLDAADLSWLGEVWMLEQPDGSALRVRLVELTGERVIVQTDDLGAVEAFVTLFELPWPPPVSLRPRRPGEAQAF